MKPVDDAIDAVDAWAERHPILFVVACFVILITLSISA